MTKFKYSASLVAGTLAMLLVCGAWAKSFDIPSGDLKTALDAYANQSGVALVVSADAVRGSHTAGVKGNYSDKDALSQILIGTGFEVFRYNSGAIGLTRRSASAPAADSSDNALSARLAAAPAPNAPGAALETVTVTSSKIGGDVQNIPISITALSQEQLTATQTAGGPDLVRQVPNLTFSKTNFTGYNIQIRGIGTQAISVTTDPAVAVALNDIPFIRNHFFEQEFYDLGQAEVLRGPQGTLYGRNATAGVVNLVTAKPTDQFEAMASGEIGNYQQRRFEGMINLPIVDDRIDLRIAGEWTKRQGYSFNALTDQRIDGRDLWSGRVSLAFNPTSKLKSTFIWEHFSEDDDRMRSAKQLCKTDVPPTSINGVPVPPGSLSVTGALGLADSLSQGCLPSSLYSPEAFGVPDGFALPAVVALGLASGNPNLDPYASTTQSQNLRVIESVLEPRYQAKNDTVEFNAASMIAPSLTVTSQTGYNQDQLSSTEDYNRFNTSSGIFLCDHPGGNFCNPNRFLALSRWTPDPAAGTNGIPAIAAIFCDPQLGCSDRLVAEDLSNEHAWQLSQEFRLASNFVGPLNFSVGGNYLHYETEENYYVFANSLTAFAAFQGDQFGFHSSLDNSDCLVPQNNGYQAPQPNKWRRRAHTNMHVYRSQFHWRSQQSRS